MLLDCQFSVIRKDMHCLYSTYPAVAYPKGRQIGRTLSVNLATARRSLTTATSAVKSFSEKLGCKNADSMP